MSVDSRVEILEIPTYEYGPQDPNPPFQRRGPWGIYPYSMLDDLGTEARPREYRALVLENEYLLVTVLPELGGHLYSAVDKSTGREIFYRNHVVKPGLVALRGAWVSGGVEFNFPRGHTVTTVSPVDARMVSEPDGSATIWVGNVEQIFRMAWAVGVRLRPGTSRIETEVRLINRTPLPHPYYFWANAAVPAREDMHMIYPGRHVLTWVQMKKRPRPWPVHEGVDLSRYTAFSRGSDCFLMDSLEDFFGVYYDELDCGVVHVANVHECFGKKFFTWGVSEAGRLWDDILSDGDGPYCEIQSGRYVDQSTWRLMPPHYTESWVEYWYPVAGTGGFAHANREAAVNIEGTPAEVKWGLAVTESQRNATLRFSIGGRVVHEQTQDLSPARALKATLPRRPDWPQGPVTLTVVEASGREVVSHTEEQPPRTLSLPEYDDSRFPRVERTAGELLLKALRAEERGDKDFAVALYEQVLALDEDCLQAAVALGRLAIGRGELEAAVSRLARAAQAAPENPEAAYYLGIALRRSGRTEEAEYPLSRAAQSPEFAYAARVEWGQLLMQLRQWERAIYVLDQALGYHPQDTRAHCLRAAALRRTGQVREAAGAIEAFRAGAPQDRLAAAEAHLCASALGRPRVAARLLRELTELVPQEADPWHELAFDYLSAAMDEEAVSLLEAASKRVPPLRDHPLTHYLLGSLLARLGRQEEASKARDRAARLSPNLAFPHHWEFEGVLREAIAANPGDPRAHYHLGTLLYGQGRREEGLRAWELAAEGLTDYGVLHRSLGWGAREVRGDLEQSERWMRRAVASNPGDVRSQLELDDVLRDRRVDPAERLARLDAAPESVLRRGTIAIRQIACCLALGEWDRAVSLVTTHTFHRWEAEVRMRTVYVNVFVGRGVDRYLRNDLKGALEDFDQALEYPWNIRQGRYRHTSDARIYWCAGVVCEALGDTEAAHAHWSKGAEETHHPPFSELAIYHALCLRKVGRVEESEKTLGKALEIARQCAALAPDEPLAELTLGIALKAAGRTEEAAEALRRARALDPHLQTAKQLLESSTVV